MSVLSRYNVTPAPAPVALTPMQQLMVVCDQVSVEAFNTGSMESFMARKGALLSHAFREAISSVLARDHTRPEVLQVVPLTRLLNTLDYTELQALVMNQPVGFKGNLLGYVQYLSADPLTHLVGLIPQVLIPAQKRFGHYLNNLSEIGQRHKFEGGAQYNTDDLRTLIEANSAWFQTGNHTATAEFGDLWETKQAFLATANQVNQINTQRFAKASPDAVNREVTKLTTVCEALLNALKTDGDAASNQFVTAITEEIRLVAQWVEWYAAVTVQLLDTTTAMKLNEGTVMSLA